jgi:hypothetical protein
MVGKMSEKNKYVLTMSVYELYLEYESAYGTLYWEGKKRDRVLDSRCVETEGN